MKFFKFSFPFTSVEISEVIGSGKGTDNSTHYYVKTRKKIQAPNDDSSIDEKLRFTNKILDEEEKLKPKRTTIDPNRTQYNYKRTDSTF